MKFTHQLFTASAACALLMMTTAGSLAETVTTTTHTTVKQKELPNMDKTNFSAFDINNDGILSMEEVGEKLFYIFDTDGNEVIDNIEFTNKKIMTIIPMEKETFKFVDYNGDGEADDVFYNYDTFITISGLMRFDKNMDGLSPDDFIEQSFIETDTDNSKVIEIDEWKKAYIVSNRPKNADPDYYNP